MLKIKFLIVCILFFEGVQSQNDFSYSPMISKGELPDDIIQKSLDKALSHQNDEISASDTKKDKKLKSEFVLKSTYSLDELLTSGKIVFGTEINETINKIGNSLLSDLNKDKIRFYILKSNSANAFSTSQGMIFFTTELLARINTESELAFVVAHEIAHYTEKHAINKFIESDKTYSQRKRLKYQNYENNIRKMSLFSQSLEFEADLIGFQGFVKQGYDLNSAQNVLEMLRISHLSMDTTKADLKILYSEIPDSILSKDNFYVNIDDNDSLQSHPAISKRVETLQKENIGTNGKQYILCTEKEIESLRLTCQIESIKLNIHNANYIQAVDNCLSFLESFPDNIFVKEELGKALYGISKYKIYDSYSDLTERYYDYTGNVNHVKYFFDDLNAEQSSVLAAHYISSLKTPSSTLTKMFEDIVLELGIMAEGDAKYFSTTPNDSTAYHFCSGLLDANKNFESVLVTVADSISENIKAANERKDFLATMSYDKRQKYLKKEAKKTEIDMSFEKGTIGAEKIVYVDPDFKIIDERKGVKLVNSEIAKETYNEQIYRCAEAANLEIDVINPKSFDPSNISKYNDYSVLNNSFSEMLTHAQFGLFNGMVLSNIGELNALTNIYDTPLFTYNGETVYKQIKRGKGLAIALSAIYIITLPIGIIYAVTPKYEAYYYNIVINSESGKFVTAKFEEISVKPTYGRTESMIYNDMSILKSKK